MDIETQIIETQLRANGVPNVEYEGLIQLYEVYSGSTELQLALLGAASAVHERGLAAELAEQLFAKRRSLSLIQVARLAGYCTHSLEMHDKAITLQEEAVTLSQFVRMAQLIGAMRSMISSSIRAREALGQEVPRELSELLEVRERAY